MDTFQYIISGAGLAGLSLAYKLQQAGVPGSSVLMIDPVRKQENDRTWCFWSKPGHAFESMVSKTWNQIAVRNGDQLAEQSAGDLPYHLIFSETFYRHIWDSLDQWSGFTFLKAKVLNVLSNDQQSFVETTQGTFSGNWVFDSRLQAKQLIDLKTPSLFQHFKGQFIRTETPVFDPEQALLMDFQDSEHPCSFFYVLPLSSQEALVEYTLFTEERVNRIELEGKVEKYLENRFNGIKYKVLRKEKGTLPMTTGLKTWSTKRHIQIGLAGNAAKPSSGYAFTRIQEQTDQIVGQLKQGKSPNNNPVKNRFTFYDNLLLKVLQEGFANGNDLMWILLSKNKPNHVFQFLSEETSLMEEARLFCSLPWTPFLKALFDSGIPEFLKSKEVVNAQAIHRSNG